MKKFNLGAKLASLFKFSKSLDESSYDELEDLLIEGDFGSKATFEISDLAREQKPKTNEELVAIARKIIEPKVQSADISPVPGKLNAFLVLGVNGVGKTTTIGKLASYYKNKGLKVVLAAGDTFRAAAIDQIAIHAQRTGARLVHQNPGSDPGAVIFDALSSAASQKEDIVLCDTAGRMHNKENLLKELIKIDKIIKTKVENDCYKKLLVVDATTGQNTISQAKIFSEAIGIDALILTKYDSSSKAGSLVQIGIPIAFVGTGESYSDIQPFDKEEFISSLLDF
ncbi:MAG: signal recognition particle-docking protein FtsY [Sphaerochaetaceae bacterium]|nr:signal recognition particle-docking protein FtsY [Sphaerochaetaceae bacterium]MDD4007692.1 signal recognition particle-docking protein FtsY [Sphaerochaetaceae bacterium]